jgi:flagellar L-ring protein precursor FlgH
MSKISGLTAARSGPSARFVYVVPLCALLFACGGPHSIVKGPTTAPPNYPIAAMEQGQNPGSIYQVSNPSAMPMIADDGKPRHIGDTVKIVISESITASTKQNVSTSRDNSVKTKGPGGANTISALVNQFINADYSASGNDKYTGTGKADNTQTLQGTLAASVINVLPNGNLQIAGEKSIAFNGAISTLKFSGVVNPRDIKTGKTVSSEDVVDARIEQVGSGQLAETNNRTWLQRYLTDKLTIW